MSILIKGIDLPNGPIKLVLYPSGKVDEYVLNERIATDYQAIQIPKGFDYSVTKFIEAIQKAEDERRSDEHNTERD